MFKNRKKLVIAILLLIILVAIACVFLINGGKYQAVHLDGYSMMVPNDYAVTAEEGKLIFTENETEIGSLELLYTECEVATIPSAMGYAPENPEVKESDKYVTKVFAITFMQGEDEINQYIFTDLPNTPPYKAVLTLKNVGAIATGRMLDSFSLPTLSGKTPPKPMEAPTDEFLQNAVYTVSRGTSVYAYRLSRLDRLIQAGTEQPIDNASVLHILSYEAGEEERSVKSWYYLSVGGGEKRLYTYEQGEDGLFFYRNNPKLIREITREVSAEENYTRYFADGELILEAPYNPYAENKDALLAYKDTLIGDNSNVSALVQKAMPAEVAMEGISLETITEPYGMTVRYVLNQPERYVVDGKLEEKAFYQNALVLFSLVPDAEWIAMEIRTGDNVFDVRYERKVAETQFESKDLSEFAADEKAFETFAEDVPKMAPPTKNNSGNGVDGTRAVYTTIVTVPSSKWVKHPRTGYMVAVKPYAERFGVTQYLDKPISVTLYEKTDAGKITMWATGSCDGVEIGSYPISSREEFDWLLSYAR